MGIDFGILGDLQVLRDGDPVDLGSRRQRLVLARLLINAGETVSSDRLIEDLWPETDPDTARHTLHVYISRLRKTLGDQRERLQRLDTGYRFVVAADELDSHRFEDLAGQGRDALAIRDLVHAHEQLSAALELWRGPALRDLADEDCLRGETTRLETLRLATLERRISADLDLGRHEHVIGEIQDLASQHPLRETIWEHLMLALYRCGRQTEALRAFQTVRARLAEDLGIEPGPSLRLLEERILTQDPALTLDGAGPSQAANQLPLQRTTFIGRAAELRDGARLLANSRLLTITGAPGSGKTRLAIELAARSHDRYPHGIFYVALAPVVQPQLLGATIARALGLDEMTGKTPLEGVTAFLRDRRALLVLDNFEQILAAAPRIGEILDSAPDVSVLMTSRAPLRIAGEQEYPLPPMSVPPPQMPDDPRSILGFDAVALFVARSQAVDPSFELTPADAPFVGQIVARVDGLPLAIELAAARTRSLHPQALLMRLEERLTMLTDAPIDSSDRHRTIRDAVAWSYDLLTPDERALYRRLAVFSGGFTIEAAGAVADLPEHEALEAIDTLVLHSLLVRPVTTGRARFAMLEIVREFAREQLIAEGEELETGQRHAAYFLHLAQQIEPQLLSDPGGSASQRLAADINNVRAALDYAVGAPDPDLGINLASCIWRYWESSEQLTEGRDWLERLLDLPDVSPDATVKGLEALAGLAYWQADYQRASSLYEQLLDLSRNTGDANLEAETLYSLSLTASWMKDLDRAERLAAEARSLFDDLGVRAGVAKALIAQATPIWFGRDYEPAYPLWVQGLEIANEVGDHVLSLTGLAGLAGISFNLGRKAEALTIALEGVEKAIAADNAHVTVWMLDLVAAFAAEDNPVIAVRLAGAADRLRAEAGGGMSPEAIQIDGARTVVAEILDPAAVRDEWARGRETDLEGAIELARQLQHLVETAQAGG